MSDSATGFAIVGCGYVADFYLATLGNHPDLKLVAVYDRDAERARRFAEHHGLHRHESLLQLLEDERVQIVANLTNPASHFEISRQALLAGKHVYSEKPLATVLADAEQLVALAESKSLLLTSAPCSILGETAQTIWRALREERIGTPRLVYADLDDGNVPRTNYKQWASESGAPWPAKDEFEVGCTLEHAGYYLTWLTAFFGPAIRTTSFASIVQPDKGIELDVHTPDFAVGFFEFRAGVTARLTCGLYAPHDHRLRIFGDEGTLFTDKSWDYGAPVYLARRHRYSFQLEKRPWLLAAAGAVGFGRSRLPLVRKPAFRSRARGSNPMDFCRGIAELAAALREGRSPRMSARWALHVNELVLSMQNPAMFGSQRDVQTSFEPMLPMPWSGGN